MSDKLQLEVGKEYKTRGGYLATIIYELYGNDKLFPFVVCIKWPYGEERVITVTRQGLKWKHELSSDDLVSPVPKKVKVEGWVNVYPDGAASLWHSKEQADAYAQPARIARKRIEFEVEEGEGL